MITATDKTGRSRRLALEGALVVQHVAEMKTKLKEALEEVDTLTIDLSETSEVDLAGLQLLCSAHRTAISLNKTLCRMGEPQEKEALGLTDMAASQGCPQALKQNCIWGQ